MNRIAIIGAGLAGLTVAKRLCKVAEVDVFEKARGVGGRMATRRADPYFFDHGAQYFTARSDAFKDFLQPLVAAGVVQNWCARFAEIDHGKMTQHRQWSTDMPHYVGVPGMNAIGKYLAEGLNVHLGTRVQRLQQGRQRKWSLWSENGESLGEFDWVISAIPAEQATELLPAELSFYPRIKNTRSSGCFSLMLGFDQTIELGYDAAIIRGNDLSWIAVNSAKPGRAGSSSVLVHSDNDWADRHLDDERSGIMRHLLQQTQAATGLPVGKSVHSVLHGWRYANIAKQSGDDFFLDTHEQLAVCGDWLIQGRVEAAFLSGDALSKRLSVALSSSVQDRH